MPVKKKWVKYLLLLLVWIGYLTPAFASLTLEDERRIGKEFYTKLEGNNHLIKNKRVTAYINSLGQRLLSAVSGSPFVYQFSVVKSQAVNAFATPGGYVYVHMGLVNLAENEGQLASVLAHEIAHVELRHIASMIEKSKKVNAAALAAIIAGAFLGGGGDLTAAVAGFSLAGITTMQLKYSREHEEAADRLALSYLVGAGYNSKAAVDFLKNMRRYEFYSKNAPSYLLTHPGIDDRIRYIDALLQTRFIPSGAEQVVGNFKRIKTLLLLARDDHTNNLRHFQGIISSDPLDVDALYGLAVSQERMGQVEQALANFHKALSLVPTDGDVLRELGISYLKQGRHEEAIFHLEQALRYHGDDPETSVNLAKAYLAKGDYREALRTLDRADIGGWGPDLAAEYYYLRATAYGRLDIKGESHFNFGRYFRRVSKDDSALYHYQEAKKYFPPESAKAREIQQEIESMRSKPTPMKR